MNKLKLDVEALEVESFRVREDGSGGKGTVFGHISERCGETGAYCPPPSEWPSNYCYTWALDSRCADSLETSPNECHCWPVE